MVLEKVGRGQMREMEEDAHHMLRAGMERKEQYLFQLNQKTIEPINLNPLSPICRSRQDLLLLQLRPISI
jgi:hypothetical protein